MRGGGGVVGVAAFRSGDSPSFTGDAGGAAGKGNLPVHALFNGKKFGLRAGRQAGRNFSRQ